MKLYHRDVFFKPSFYNFVAKGVQLNFSKHLVERLIERGIDVKKIPSVIHNIANVRVVETETLDDGITIIKQLIRYPYDARSELVLAIMRDGFVKTAWVNSKVDNHKTLDTSRYERKM